MKTIVLVCHDGARTLAFVVPVDFDTQTWADARRESLRLIGVVKVVEEEVTCPIQL